MNQIVVSFVALCPSPSLRRRSGHSRPAPTLTPQQPASSRWPATIQQLSAVAKRRVRSKNDAARHTAESERRAQRDKNEKVNESNVIIYGEVKNTSD